MAVFPGSVNNIENNNYKTNRIDADLSSDYYPNVQAVIDYSENKEKKLKTYIDIVAEGESSKQYELSVKYTNEYIQQTTTSLKGYTDHKSQEAYNDSMEYTDNEISTIIDNMLVGKKTNSGGEIFNHYEDGEPEIHYVDGDTSKEPVEFGNYKNSAVFGATARGIGTEANGDYSTAFGKFTEALGKGSVAGGFASFADDENSLAFGYFCDAAAPYAIAIGKHSQALAENALAFGEQVLATLKNQVAFGQFNKTNPDALFLLGNGDSHETRQNAFEILNTGAGTIQTQGNEPNSIVQKQYVDNLIGDIETLLGGI